VELNFKRWLEDAGETFHVSISNQAAEDGFNQLPGNVTGRKTMPSKFDPNKKFGFQRKTDKTRLNRDSSSKENYG